MSLTATTLAGSIGAGDTTIVVASATNLARGQKAKIDSEIVSLQAQNPAAPLQWSVARGQDGTRAVPHESGAAVVTGQALDWSVPVPPAIYTYGVAGRIAALPGLHELNTGAASAFDLPSPALDQDGIVLTIAAKTGHAYTVQSDQAFLGSPGAGEDTAVFSGGLGDNFSVIAQGGRWLVLSSSGVTYAT